MGTGSRRRPSPPAPSQPLCSRSSWPRLPSAPAASQGGIFQQLQPLAVGKRKPGRCVGKDAIFVYSTSLKKNQNRKAPWLSLLTSNRVALNHSGAGAVAREAKDGAVPREYQTPKGSSLSRGGVASPSSPPQAVWAGRSRGEAAFLQTVPRRTRSQVGAEPLPLCPGELKPHLTACVYPFIFRLPAGKRLRQLRHHLSTLSGASRAPAGRGGRGGWRAQRRLSPEHPLPTPRGARQLPPHRLLAHHAGYFHPDVFCHHRPGDPLLHHLHALERCRGRRRCGPASALQSKHRPAAAWSVSLRAFWKSINPLRAPSCPGGAVPGGPPAARGGRVWGEGGRWGGRGESGEVTSPCPDVGRSR
ncbi:uncharacterized protein LOC141732665 [Larus michahellis]|uniref:uncharacterized protein LOC141732665 n=1 Tax=Larus michahellis TaxID=119627 RepID=UPI003D9BA150